MNRRVLFLAIALVAVYSCNKQEDETPFTKEPFFIRAVIETSKVEIDGAGKTYWSEGDEIGVFSNSEIVKFTISDGAGTAEGVFVTEDEYRGKSFNGVAVYPYDQDLTINGKEVTIKLAESCSEEARIPVPMVGTVKESGAYSFRNVSSVLRITYTNLPSMAQSVRVTTSSPITGMFTLSDYASSVLALKSGEGGNVVNAFLPKLRKNNTAWIDIPVPQGTISSIKAELLDVTGAIIDTRNTTSAKSFTAGIVKPLDPVNIPGDRMKVEWIWDSGATPPFRSNIPAIDDNGNVYVISNEGVLNKINNKGTLVWTTLLSGAGGKVETSPSVEKDGSAVYISAGQDGAGVIYSLNSDGSLKWRFNSFPWGDMNIGQKFWQSIPAIGDNNLYVPVGTLCTLLTIDKSSGDRVSYGTGTSDGSRSNLGGLSTGAVIGLSGTVTAMAQDGAYTWNKQWLDSPTNNNSTYGKFAPWGYNDMWPGWGTIEYDNLGSLAAKKAGLSTDIIISCMQEDGGRFDVCCYPASFGLNYTLKAHDNSVTKYYWRHQIGSNRNDNTSPAIQDQGGIVMGHENLVVIVPMKNRSSASDPKIGYGGLYSVWVGRNEDDGGSASWRMITQDEEVAGAAAVDNNGNVHFATDTYYYIIKPNTSDDTCETIARIDLKNLIMGSGFISFPANRNGNKYTGVWSSVKIANNGRIYLNVNLSSTRGVTCCFTYPGVTGPDNTSSWPQKGADQYNSGNQQL